MELPTEIQDLISKTLPEATAKEMKKFIENAEETVCELALSRNANKNLQDAVAGLKEEIARLRVFEEQAKWLNDKEKNLAILADEVSEQQKNLEVKELEIRLDAATNSNAEILRLVDKVFGHPSVRVETSRAVKADIDQYGNPIYASPNYVVDTETTTKGKD